MNELPVGQLFSHVYLSGGPLLHDKETFRRRLGVYCQKNFEEYNQSLGDVLRMETGLQIPHGYPVYDFEKFFHSMEIRNVLDAITLIWQFYDVKKRLVAKLWLDFVSRVFREEKYGLST